MSLTEYQAKRLSFLAKKAGISLRIPKTRTIRMSRKEKRSIEEGLEQHKRVVVTCRNGHGVRVFSMSGYKAIGENMKNYHKTRKGA
jgi:hypothetical protein